MIASKSHQFDLQMSCTPSFVPLNECKENFKEHLQKYFDPKGESFSGSLGYYLITARQGGWVHWANDTVCVVCWHPNCEGQLLVFPAIGREKQLHYRTISELPSFTGKIQLARVPLADADDEVFALSSLHFVDMAKQEEELILDWRYPAHVISTSAAGKLEGNDFYYARRKYKKFDSNEFLIEPFQQAHLDDVLLIGANYAKTMKRSYSDYSLDEAAISECHRQIVLLALNSPESLNSVVLKYQERIVGLYVWDKTGEVANALWFTFNRHIDGLGFAQVVEVSKYLYDQGIQYLNLGGSETEGMDFFKTRFRPVRSFHLKSILIEQNEHQRTITLPTANDILTIK